MYFYRKNGVWTYFNLWKHHNMVPFLLSDQRLTSPSESEEQNLSHLLICNISGELSTWLAHRTCAENQTRPTSSSTAFQYNLGIFPLTFMLPWFFFNQERPSFFFLSLCPCQFNLLCRTNASITSLLKVAIRTASDSPLAALMLPSGSNCHNQVWSRSTTWQCRGRQDLSNTSGSWSPEARLRGSHHSFTCENMSLNLDCPQGKCHWSLTEGTSYRGTQTMAGPWGEQCITRESLFRKPDFQMAGISVSRGC